MNKNIEKDLSGNSFSKYMSDFYSVEAEKKLFDLLKSRLEKRISFHKNLSWENIYTKLLFQKDKIHSLLLMEKSGGEPEFVKTDDLSAEYIFMDCSPESPAGRRSLCYDDSALNSRKENKPKNSAMELALDMGIELLDENSYRTLQQFGNFDTKTSSWLATPDEIRTLGGAIFGDKRYNKVFIYHNGAESYYASRGFRGLLKV